MATTTRPARLADAGAIATLTGHLGYDVEVSEVAERLGRILARHDQRVWVAEVDGLPAGWLHALMAEHIDSGAFVEIAGLVVARPRRRRGVGTSLVDQAEQWARENGYALLRLQCSSGRIDSHRFYEQRGFTHVKTQLSFAKATGGSLTEHLKGLVPRIDR